MISSLFKLIKKECGLTQQALADVLGVSLDRVKSITSGKVQKLTREEGEALIKKLHIRAEWLVTGEGPMLQSANQQEFQRRLDTLAEATRQASAAGLSEQGVFFMQRMLTAYFSADISALVALASQAPTEIEAMLIADFRNIESPEARAAVLRTCAAFAHQPAIVEAEAPTMPEIEGPKRIPRAALIPRQSSNWPDKKFTPPKIRTTPQGANKRTTPQGTNKRKKDSSSS